MGDGLKRVAKLCGGLVATDGRTTVHYDGEGNPKGRDWQTIETAPRDGTDVLLWDGHSVEMGWWNPDAGDSGAWADSECLPLRPTPTHWQPIPTPPES